MKTAKNVPDTIELLVRGGASEMAAQYRRFALLAYWLFCQ